jgi:hypothetical protein
MNTIESEHGQIHSQDEARCATRGGDDFAEQSLSHRSTGAISSNGDKNLAFSVIVLFGKMGCLSQRLASHGFLCYTRRAAGEMAWRIREELKRYLKAEVGTFDLWRNGLANP